MNGANAIFQPDRAFTPHGTILAALRKYCSPARVIGVWTESAEQPTIAATRQLASLYRALKERPIDEDSDHAADQILEDALLSDYKSEFLGLMGQVFATNREQDFSHKSSFMKLVARLRPEVTRAWGWHWATTAIRDPHLPIRILAGRCFERWEDPLALPLLDERASVESSVDAKMFFATIARGIRQSCDPR